MRFASPEWLWLLAALPGLVLVVWLGARGRRRALERFAGGHDRAPAFLREVNPHLRIVRALLLLVAAASGITALARPQWGTRLEPVTRKGVDVVLALDVSLSMAAQDVPPDRLSAAKHAATALVRKLGGDRLALVTFAGKATLECPLTLDGEAVGLFLEAADVDAVPAKGTSLREAARIAVLALGPSAGEGTERSRALVVLSDGEDHEGGLDDAIRVLKEARVSAYAIGYGTRGGAPIPSTADDRSPSGYKKDREGRLVTTRLEDGPLGQLTLATGGRYFDATAVETEVDEVAKAIAGMDAREYGTVLRARYEERFQLPLALAVAATLALTALPDRRGAAGIRNRNGRSTP